MSWKRTRALGRQSIAATEAGNYSHSRRYSIGAGPMPAGAADRSKMISAVLRQTRSCAALPRWFFVS